METHLYPALRAFIVNDGKVLIIKESSDYLRSPNKGKYDLPGGKVRPNEEYREALKREVKEEVGLDIRLGKAFSISEWRPVVDNEKHHIVATFIECFTDSTSVTLGKEYEEYRWIAPKDFKNYDIINTLIPAFEDYILLKGK